MRVLTTGDVVGRLAGSGVEELPPANYLPAAPERGHSRVSGTLVDNLIGRYNGALVEIDEAAGRATGIERVDRGLG
jgi:hypothetical protein